MVAFVNYELFRREYKPFRMLTNFLLFFATVFTSISLFELYLIATKLDNRYRSLSLLASFCVLIFMNIYLTLASYMSKLVEQVMYELITLMSRLAEYPDLQVLPTLNIWRRQMLSEKEVRLFVSTRIFAYSVSYTKIVSFNAHLAGLWLILWRVVGNGSQVGDKRVPPAG